MRVKKSINKVLSSGRFKIFLTKQRVIGLLLIAFVALSGLFLLLSRSEIKTTTFDGNLKALIASVEALQDGLKVPDAKYIENDLNTYHKRLNEVDLHCKALQKLKQPNKQPSGKAAGERVDGICQDLKQVTHYSRLLHERIQDYVLLPDTEWPQPGSDEFDSRLKATNEVIADTRYYLEGLDNSKIQDPALDELIYQVKFAQDIALKVKEAGNNTEEARKQAEELRLQLSRDKTDFLAARQYFWNNTIGIAQLHKALKDVEFAINPNQPTRFNNP